MDISSITNRTDITELPQATNEGQRINLGTENTTTESDHSPLPSNSPTDGARDATANHPPTHDDIERMTADRLNNDPEYRDLQQKYDNWKGLESDFAIIDHYTGVITDDGVLTLENLRAIANDPFFPNPEAKAAAQRLLNNMPIWNELAKGDNRVGTHDVTDFIANMKNQLKAMKDDTRAAVTAELTPPSASAAASAVPGASAAAGAAASAGSTGSEALFQAPPLSTKPGMEGAVENIGNTLTAIGNATSDLAAQLANPDLKPEDRQKLQAKYNELQQLQSMLTAMYTQIQEAIANLMKMYSDVAKNSIQNMR